MPKPLSDEKVALVRKLFPDHTNVEIHEITGVSLNSISRIQARYHLRKSRQHLHNMGVRAGKASNIARGGDSSSCHTPSAIAKRSQSYKETYRLEEMRRRWGLEQRTKIRLPHGTKHYRDQISYLKGLGYIIDEAKKIAYYTPGTHRARRLESAERGKPKGYMLSHFDFRPYGE